MGRHDITWLELHMWGHSGGAQLSSSAQNPQMPVVLAPWGLCSTHRHSRSSAAVWHHPAKTSSCGEIVSGATGTNPLYFPPSLTPSKTASGFQQVCFGAAGTRLQRSRAPADPSHWLGFWVDTEGCWDGSSWAAQSQSAAGPSASPCPSEGSGVQLPHIRQRGPFSGKAGFWGRGNCPTCAHHSTKTGLAVVDGASTGWKS